MKKQIISTVAAVALAASLAMPAAAWQPSRVQQSGTGTAASTPSGTTSTELEVVNEVPTGTDGKAINVETSQNPWIKVTAVADTLAANEKFGADLSFSQKAGELTQRTEDTLGAYALHDFFLYHMMDSGASPLKLYPLAKAAFDGQYADDAILAALRTFVRRFFTQQFKRSAMPDGPKVGSVAVSPRGDLRMPSDACVKLWREELDQL